MINKIRSITIAVALLLAAPYSTANAVTSNAMALNVIALNGMASNAMASNVMTLSGMASNAMALSINSFLLNSLSTLRFSDSTLWEVLIGQPQQSQKSEQE